MSQKAEFEARSLTLEGRVPSPPPFLSSLFSFSSHPLGAHHFPQTHPPPVLSVSYTYSYSPPLSLPLTNVQAEAEHWLLFLLIMVSWTLSPPPGNNPKFTDGVPPLLCFQTIVHCSLPPFSPSAFSGVGGGGEGVEIWTYIE